MVMFVKLAGLGDMPLHLERVELGKR